MSLSHLSRNFGMLLNTRNDRSLCLPLELSWAGACNKIKPNPNETGSQFLISGISCSFARRAFLHPGGGTSASHTEESSPGVCSTGLVSPFPKKDVVLPYAIWLEQQGMLGRDVILCGIFSTSSNRCSLLMNNTLY